jgi:hypothetical protein
MEQGYGLCFEKIPLTTEWRLARRKARMDVDDKLEALSLF